MGIIHPLNTSLVIFLVAITSQVLSAQDKPLILTPLLNSNKIKEAQALSQVKPDMNGSKSYSGFLTVNQGCGSHYFFWFVLAEVNWEKAPILLVSDANSALNSMFGDYGPFKHLNKKGFVKNQYHWGISNNLLFVDQPVGTGFSFSEKHCHANDLTQVAQETYSFLIQFFKLFPNLRNNKFFIVGNRFAAKYALSIAYEIDQENNKHSDKINLQGLVLGNPLIDARCEQIPDYLFQLGIYDEKQKDQRKKFDIEFKKYINQKKYQTAYKISKDFDSKFTTDIVGSNILAELDFPTDYREFEFYVRSYNVRKQIHVANIPYNAASDPAYNFLDDDMLKPSTPELQHLLQTNKYILGFYFGQFDAYFSYATLPCVLREIKWPGYTAYYNSNHTEWYLGTWLAGWFKTSGNMFEAVVRKSGGNVLGDQPQAALELLNAAIASSRGSTLLKGLPTQPK